MAWYKDSFSERLKNSREYFKIRDDLTAGTNIKEVNSYSVDSTIVYQFLLTRKESYILNLEFNSLPFDERERNLSVKILSFDRQKVKEEIERARILIDNVVRVQRQCLKLDEVIK